MISTKFIDRETERERGREGERQRGIEGERKGGGEAGRRGEGGRERSCTLVTVGFDRSDGRLH